MFVRNVSNSNQYGQFYNIDQANDNHSNEERK